MRRIVLFVLLALVFATFVASEETKVSKAIGEYPIGEFAVKGQVELLLNQLVAEIKGRMTDGDLQITVVGSADTTGSSVSNDRLAKDRAEQVAAFLSANFPDAKIIAWSKGDAENVRQVRVEYKIIPIPVPVSVFAPAPEPAKPKKPSDVLEHYVVGTVILFAIFILLWTKIGRRSRKSRVKKAAKTGIQWINLEVKGEKYSIRVEVENGEWCSPFFSKSGTVILRHSKKGIIDSLKGCLKKSEFRFQKDELIRKGIIVFGQK